MKECEDIKEVIKSLVDTLFEELWDDGLIGYFDDVDYSLDECKKLILLDDWEDYISDFNNSERTKQILQIYRFYKEREQNE